MRLFDNAFWKEIWSFAFYLEEQGYKEKTDLDYV